MNAASATGETIQKVLRFRMTLRSNADVARAVTQARSAGEAAGLDAASCAEAGTALSEIATNALKYAADGVIDVHEVRGAGRAGIEVTVTDQGPGIGDIEQAMRENYTTGGSLGLGLAGAQRLMDDMHIESTPGTGTTVVMRKWG